LKARILLITHPGALGEVTARDGFLASLCEFAVAPADGCGPGGAPGDGPAAPSLQAAGAVLTAALSQAPRGGGPSAASGAGDGGGPGGGGSSGSGASASAGPPPALGTKNIHSLRTLFNVSHRLADSLGHAWVFVVEVLFALERALPPTGGQGSGKVRGLWCRCGAWLRMYVDQPPLAEPSQTAGKCPTL
jgi:hypothetical protein